MKESITAFLIAVLIGFSLTTEADSPLTSTGFHVAYEDHPIIILAASSGGKLNGMMMDYLINDDNPVDVKMALINRLGWSIEGKNNAENFLQHLKQKGLYGNRQMLLKSNNSGLLISYAYLLAMDNYFEVAEALEIARQASVLQPESYTVSIIAGLIASQSYMDSGWGMVFEQCDLVRRDRNLLPDMKPEAVEIIFEYMDLYDPVMSCP